MQCTGIRFLIFDSCGSEDMAQRLPAVIRKSMQDQLLTV